MSEESDQHIRSVASMSSSEQGPIVVWVGRFFSHDGYGTAARLHVDALRRVGIDIAAVDIDSCKLVGPVRDAIVDVVDGPNSLELRPIQSDRHLAVVVHDRPDNYPRVVVHGRAGMIGFSYWETTELPAGWASWMSSMDRVWAASSFNSRGFIASGVPERKIDRVGHPVDPLLVRVRRDRHLLRQRWAESTVLLSIVSSVNGRRDLALLVEAYDEAFQADENVVLLMKVPPNAESTVTGLIEATRAGMTWKAACERPKIRLISEELSREQMVRLHASVDCYVSCERGNGWDLPAMDSIGLDVPVVAPDFGASTDFLRRDDCFLVGSDSLLVSSDGCRTSGHPLYSGHLWPYVEPLELAARLREVASHVDRREDFGRRAGRRIRSDYDESAVAQALWRVLTSISDVAARSGSRAAVRVTTSPDAWSVREPVEIDQSPVVAELELLGQFGEPAKRSLIGLLASYRRGVAVIGARGAVLDGTRGRRAMSAAMSVSTARPLAKLRAIRRLEVEFAAIRRRYETETTVDQLLEAAHQVVAAAGSHEAFRLATRDDEALDNRRLLWSFAGPFKTSAADRERISSLRGRHLGERVFVMGNGPSLLQCDLAALANEYTFGVNKIHLLFDKIDWRPDFYTLLDWKMGPAMVGDMHHLSSSVKFLPQRFRGLFETDERTFWYHPRPVGVHVDDQFATDIEGGIPSRATVLVSAIQQAFYLGFRDIILIGVDASYSIPSTVKQSGPDKFGTGTKLHLESTADDDPNHFDPGYFGKGAKWHDPNVDDMRRMLEVMRSGVERHGGRLLNATVGGSLEEVPRVDFETVVADRRSSQRR